MTDHITCKSKHRSSKPGSIVDLRGHCLVRKTRADEAYGFLYLG